MICFFKELTCIEDSIYVNVQAALMSEWPSENIAMGLHLTCRGDGDMSKQRIGKRLRSDPEDFSEQRPKKCRQAGPQTDVNSLLASFNSLGMQLWRCNRISAD